MPIGASEPIAAPTTCSVRTRVVVQLEGPDHLQVVAGAATDERQLRADDAVRAADDLLLVAGEAVGEQHEDPVLVAVDAGGGVRDAGAGSRRLPAGALAARVVAWKPGPPSLRSSPSSASVAARRPAVRASGSALRPTPTQRLGWPVSPHAWVPIEDPSAVRRET